MTSAAQILLHRLPEILHDWNVGPRGLTTAIRQLASTIVDLFERAYGHEDFALVGPTGLKVLCMCITQSAVLNPCDFHANAAPLELIRCARQILNRTQMDRAQLAREFGCTSTQSSPDVWNDWRQRAPCAALLELECLRPNLATFKVVMRRWRAYTSDMIVRFARAIFGDNLERPAFAPGVQENVMNASIAVQTAYGIELMDMSTWTNLTFEVLDMNRRDLVQGWFTCCRVRPSEMRTLASTYLRKTAKFKVPTHTRSATQFLLATAHNGPDFFARAADDCAYNVFVRQHRPAMQTLFSNCLSVAKLSLLVWESDLTLERMLTINYKWLFSKQNKQSRCNVAPLIVSVYIMRRLLKALDGRIRMTNKTLPHHVSSTIISFCWFRKQVDI